MEDMLREKKEDREGGREEGRCRGKHVLPAFHMCPNWGQKLKPRYVPCSGIELTTFPCTGRCSTN